MGELLGIIWGEENTPGLTWLKAIFCAVVAGQKGRSPVAWLLIG
jgi:hypothetical protein